MFVCMLATSVFCHPHPLECQNTLAHVKCKHVCLLLLLLSVSGAQVSRQDDQHYGGDCAGGHHRRKRFESDEG
jgi:hypothetical protein